MNTQKSSKVQPIPEGYTAVTPWIISPDTKGVIGFITDVLGGQEIPNSRLTNEDGAIIHVVVKIEGALVMLFDAKKEWAPSPAYLNVYVADVESTYEKALKYGAKSVTDITFLWFGEKVARVLDPFGNLWWINERVEDIDLTDKEVVMKRSATSEAVKGIAYIQKSLNDAMLTQKAFFEGRRLDDLD